MVDILEVSQKRVDIVVTISYNMTMQLVLVKKTLKMVNVMIRNKKKKHLYKKQMKYYLIQN